MFYSSSTSDEDIQGFTNELGISENDLYTSNEIELKNTLDHNEVELDS